MTSVHELKILPEFFQAVKRGDKRFELRKKDRNYQVGDMLILQEWTGRAYTGESIARFITYVYNGKGKYGLAEGYCILGIAPRRNCNNRSGRGGAVQGLPAP